MYDLVQMAVVYDIYYNHPFLYIITIRIYPIDRRNRTLSIEFQSPIQYIFFHRLQVVDAAILLFANLQIQYKKHEKEGEVRPENW